MFKLLPLLAFAIFSLTCSSKFSFSSRGTPKYFWLDWLLENTVGSVNLWLFPEKIIFFMSRNVRIEGHFPLICPFWKFLWLFTQHICRLTGIFYNQKRCFVVEKRSFVTLFIWIKKTMMYTSQYWHPFRCLTTQDYSLVSIFKNV